MSSIPKRLHIQEVAPRDGFQMEPIFVPTELKIDFINTLVLTGLSKIEVTSFTSPKAIPALADAEAVMRGVKRLPNVEFAALVPNLRGCERALACGVDEINVVMSVSASHNRANLRLTPEESLAQIAAIAKTVGNRTQINISLATAFGCPFDGDVPLDQVVTLVERIVDLGLERISLCDTTGMANPLGVKRAFETMLSRWPGVTFTAHFHNTRGMGLANALAACQCGIDRFDASLGGLGGCPFAPGATGNVCTEDLVHMFDAMGVETGVDLNRLIEISLRLPRLVGHEVPSQVAKAGPWTRRYPLPADQA